MEGGGKFCRKPKLLIEAVKKQEKRKGGGNAVETKTADWGCLKTGLFLMEICNKMLHFPS